MQLILPAVLALAAGVLADISIAATTVLGTTPVVSQTAHDTHEHVQDLRLPCECSPADCPPFLNGKAVSVVAIIRQNNAEYARLVSVKPLLHWLAGTRRTVDVHLHCLL